MKESAIMARRLGFWLTAVIVTLGFVARGADARDCASSASSMQPCQGGVLVEVTGTEPVPEAL